MFRPSLGHLQALKEQRSKIIQVFHINALRDPKCSQNYYKCSKITKYMCIWILRFVVATHNTKILKQSEFI
jgi:hypothetical protein